MDKGGKEGPRSGRRDPNEVVATCDLDNKIDPNIVRHEIKGHQLMVMVLVITKLQNYNEAIERCGEW